MKVADNNTLPFYGKFYDSDAMNKK
jgi:hypothetical protein